MSRPGKAGITLVALGLVAFVAAWTFANPPGHAPDEPAHYVRALGVGAGDWGGRKHRPTARERQLLARERQRPSSPATGPMVKFNEAAFVWFARNTRQFRVPPELSDVRFDCEWRSDAPGCGGPTRFVDREQSLTGTFQPYPYALAGPSMRLARDAVGALFVARVVLAITALLLVLGALAALWSPRAPALSVIGVVAAVTPTAASVMGALTASGLETSGAIAVIAALLRLLRDERAPRWVWAVLGLGGLVMATARPVSAAFMVLGVLAVLAVFGSRRALALIRAEPRPAAAVGIVVAAGAAAGVLWSLRYQPSYPGTVGGVLEQLFPSFEAVPGVLHQVAGNFGNGDVVLPAAPYGLWLLTVGALLVAAMVAGWWRRAAALAAVVAGVALGVAGLEAVQRQIGVGAQGREILPLAVLVPLLCGEVVFRGRERLGAVAGRVVAIGVAMGAGAVQLAAWWANARGVTAGADGTWWFFGEGLWEPGPGWAFWALVVLAGAAAVIAGTALAAMAPRARPASD